MKKTIGIVGSRRRNSVEDYLRVLAAFNLVYNPGDDIVSGGCPEGADRFAEIIAGHRGVTPIIHYPDKSKLDPELLKKAPRAAYAKICYARNKLIALDAFVLIACVADDRRGGTEDTIKHFRRKPDFSADHLIIVDSKYPMESITGLN